MIDRKPREKKKRQREKEESEKITGRENLEQIITVAII